MADRAIYGAEGSEIEHVEALISTLPPHHSQSHLKAMCF